MKRENRIGEKHTTKEGYEVEIVEYINNTNCTLKFKSDILLYKIQYDNVKRGKVSYPFHRTLYGVGFLGIGNYTSSKNRKIYISWANMFKRCYSELEEAYKNTRVCDDWHNFQVFAEWFDKNYIEGFALDKDILVKGNKIYSPETCCFVPQEVNNLFVKSKREDGESVLGVYHIKKTNKFRANIGIGKRHSKHIGNFSTSEEAFQAYVIAKEERVRELANKWKNIINIKVYQALLNYKV